MGTKQEFKNVLSQFLEYLEDNYYFNSGGWVHIDTGKWVSRDQILESFLKENYFQDETVK